jgi:polyvinyl alcohol dehydrogenase (cytochrome)
MHVACKRFGQQHSRTADCLRQSCPPFGTRPVSQQLAIERERIEGVAHERQAVSRSMLKSLERRPSARVTGTPKFYRGRLSIPVSSIEEAIAASPTNQCCTFRGSVVELDAATGEQAWKTFVIPEQPTACRTNTAGMKLFGPSGAAIRPSPTIDEKRHVLYIATGGDFLRITSAHHRAPALTYLHRFV